MLAPGRVDVLQTSHDQLIDVSVTQPGSHMKGSVTLRLVDRVCVVVALFQNILQDQPADLGVTLNTGFIFVRTFLFKKGK